VQIFYKLFKFTHAATGRFIRGIICLWRKERHGAIAPVIFHSLASTRIDICIFKLIKFKNRHEFYGSHTQLCKIRNFFSKAAIRSRSAHSILFAGGKTFYMGLVNN